MYPGSRPSTATAQTGRRGELTGGGEGYPVRVSAVCRELFPSWDLNEIKAAVEGGRPRTIQTELEELMAEASYPTPANSTLPFSAVRISVPPPAVVSIKRIARLMVHLETVLADIRAMDQVAGGGSQRGLQGS